MINTINNLITEVGMALWLWGGIVYTYVAIKVRAL